MRIGACNDCDSATSQITRLLLIGYRSQETGKIPRIMRSFVSSLVSSPLDLRGPSCVSRQYSTLRNFCIRIQTPAGWEDSQDYGYLRIAGLKSNRTPRLVNVPVPTAAIFGTLRRYETFVVRMQTRGDWKETQDYGYPPVTGLKYNHISRLVNGLA